ncbi:MAG TPA: hypothetical protein VK184_25630 [Nostocaceae cyanobacterium]|nr:hypothetical protein [Nostocaceae cyanobacterium]
MTEAQLANLNREGTDPKYGERKETRGVSVTPTTWENMEQAAIQLGCNSRSDLLEKLFNNLPPEKAAQIQTIIED